MGLSRSSAVFIINHDPGLKCLQRWKSGVKPTTMHLSHIHINSHDGTVQVEFYVPLNTLQVISETGALSSDVHLPFSNGGPRHNNPLNPHCFCLTAMTSFQLTTNLGHNSAMSLLKQHPTDVWAGVEPSTINYATDQ